MPGKTALHLMQSRGAGSLYLAFFYGGIGLVWKGRAKRRGPGQLAGGEGTHQVVKAFAYC
jgi:hypothetical protein